MEYEMQCDAKTLSTGHGDSLDGSERPAVNADEEEEEAALPNKSAWRTRQVVEEMNVSPLSMNNLAVEEHTVRRRKGRTENGASEIRNSIFEVTKDTNKKTYGTLETSYDTSDSEDDFTETVKRSEKKKKIRKVLSSEPLDLKVLKELAISSGGLIDDVLRKETWPLLMGLGQGEPELKKPEMEVVKGHRDYQQVVLDVKRTLKRFPPGIEDARRLVLMDQLTVLIIRVLMRHPDLHYYQGYHDVAITFLLVTGEDMGFQLVEKLSVTHLRDFMGPTMEKTNYYLTYLYPILKRANLSLYKCLVESGVDTVFCLPWLITWFAHTLSDYRNVVRLYDFFLASHDLMPMYIATAIVLQKEKELLAEEEREVSAIFAILSKDPDNLPFEDILVRARELYEEYPPATLKDDVDAFIVERNEKEKKESQRIAEMRRKNDTTRFKRQRFVDRVLAYMPIPQVVPEQRWNLFKLALFTASILIARTLYKQYYTSAIEYSVLE